VTATVEDGEKANEEHTKKRGSKKSVNSQSIYQTRCPNPKVSDKRWARNYDCCTQCLTTLKPHAAKGLCKECYAKLNQPEEEKPKCRKPRAAKGVRFECMSCSKEKMIEDVDSFDPDTDRCDCGGRLIQK